MEDKNNKGSVSVDSSALISVIIPAFNVEEYVAGSIQSVLSQSHPEFEIIVVDDGSTDSTGSICDQFASAYSNVRVLHKKNGGLSDARNYGLDHASGRWTFFLDGDDVIDSGCIAALHAAIVDSGADVAVCSLRRIASQKELEKSPDEQPFVVMTGSAYVSKLICKEGNVSACGKLAATEMWKNHLFPVDRLYEDYAPVLGLLSSSASVTVTPTEYVGYVMRPGSITALKQYDDRHVNDLSAVLELAQENLTANAPELIANWPAFFTLARLRVAARLPPPRSEASTESMRVFARQTRRDMPQLFLRSGVNKAWRLRAALYYLSPALYRALFYVFARVSGKRGI